jgi:cytochrome c oxidase assembly factor CtaG
VLTFAHAPLYPMQAAATAASGFDPLVDQQLAGLMMWVPPDVVDLGVALTLFLRWLGPLSTADEPDMSRVGSPVPVGSGGGTR